MERRKLMKQKLTLLMAATLLLGAVLFINSVAWCFEKQTPTRIPSDQIFAPSFPGQEKDRAFCIIQNDDGGGPEWFFADFDSGTAVAVHMNPAQCGGLVNSFRITDVHFYLYGYFSDSAKWPAEIQVNIRDIPPGGKCDGPDTVLYSEGFSIPSDSSWAQIGMMNLSLSQPYCVNHPFFLEIEYISKTDPDHPYLPSFLMDDAVTSADTCNNWVFTDGDYYEWFDAWDPLPGDAFIRATGYTSPFPCDSEWYWKADKPDQEFPAPNGMPDFDQYQFGDSNALCGPTAVANCLWWFNAVPPKMEPPDFIRFLSTYFKCNPYNVGTYVDSMEFGLDQYFIDYGFDLYEHSYFQPNFYDMEDSLKKSQDIILLLGFWWSQDTTNWYREGGHFVTMAGVCSESLKIALSDPARDAGVGDWPGRVRPLTHPPAGDYLPELHNDPTYVSQDMYQSILNPPFPSPGNPYWELNYPFPTGELSGINVPGEFRLFTKPAPEGGKGIFATEVEYVVMICPGAWYWKPDTTHAPSGMPDFDQNQDQWQSYCGPAAVANCLWWYDAVPKDMTPPELVELLAEYFHTDPDSGTYVDSMQIGLDQYFNDYSEFNLQEYTFWKPDFHEMEESLKVCQDIILLLGFWYYDGQEWWRQGGHFVTMAGVHSEGRKVAFSDPDNDAAVKGRRPGRVRPPEHPPYPDYSPTLHNDTTYVSHDVYNCTINPESPSPGSNKWEIEDYYTIEREKYSGKNVPQRFKAYNKPAAKPTEYVWHTEVEAAIMICPKTSAVEGETEGALTPKDFELYQNYPNPFNNETIIKFNLRKSAEVTLVIYNILGQKIRTLKKGHFSAGPISVSWDGKDEKGNELSSGIYFYQLKAGEVTQTKRLVLLK